MRLVRLMIPAVAAVCLGGSPVLGAVGDEQTPAGESICDSVSGNLFGLCNAYCEAKDCDSDDPKGAKACDKILSNYKKASGGALPPCALCGNGILDAGEDFDPPPGPFASAVVDPSTCRFDFSNVRQLYCNFNCSWAGGPSCDQAEADILCKLKTDNPLSTADSWTEPTALPEAGFACAPLGYGTPLPDMSSRGVTVAASYQDSSILANHGAGVVIADPVCTNP